MNAATTGRPHWAARVARLLPLALLLPAFAVNAEPIVLDFWNGFTGPDGKYVQHIVDNFNKENEGKVNVRMVVMQWTDFYAKVSLALRSQRAPDIGIVHYDQVRSVIEQGIVMPLDEWYGQFPLDDYVPSAANVSLYEGHRYGVPLDFHPFVFYWNKKLFAQVGLDPESPPRTREAFLEVCRRVHEAHLGTPERPVWPCTVTTDWPHFLLWQNIFFCNGGRMFSDDLKTPLFDSPAGVDALQFMHDLIYKWQYSPANTRGSEGMESFRRGTTAMELNGIWMLTSFKDTPGLDFGACSMINLGTAKHVILTGAHTMVLFKKRWPDPRRIDASIAFIRYLSNNSVEWAKANLIPTRYSILHSPELRAIPYLAQIAGDVEHYAFPDAHYRYTEGIQEIMRQINLCLLNKISPEDAVKEASRVTAIALSQEPD